MSTARPSLTNEEIARQGDEIYNRLLQGRLEPDQNGKIVAIDVDSEDYEVGTDVLDTADLLRARRPERKCIFCESAIGYFIAFALRGDSVRHDYR